MIRVFRPKLLIHNSLTVNERVAIDKNRGASSKTLTKLLKKINEISIYDDRENHIFLSKRTANCPLIGKSRNAHRASANEEIQYK